ncbi:Eco57I restriction-modification methylase domain-containing protein [Bradyrhizobium liaoningense]|uniref:Eco57I restriction-modification methylase domain-containing protein n=1 Tax=Bradyrhizobium liaoningense TaxID=43992 RepID=UPI0004BC7511|nr:N-6 DNA methylase [Bradyrhizobium liaoningense]
MTTKKNESAQKLRGGYYTSPDVARWLCEWAIRAPSDTVLEPSCGAGAFLIAAADRFAALKTPTRSIASRISAVEITPSEAKSAVSLLRAKIGAQAERVVEISDYFAWWERNDRQFDAVIGNPPFIRYQSFPEPHRTRAMEIMHSLGLSPNRLTNIWVPFVVAASARLKKGGRLALILPAEILQVTYAAQLRKFLADRFTHLDIVTCNQLFFDAEQEVVLLLADGACEPSESNDCRVSMTVCDTLAEITQRSPSALLKSAEPKVLRHNTEKWLKYFLSASEIAFMRELRESDSTTNMSTHASVDVGVVTGRNEFFVLTQSQVQALRLGKYTSPLVSRSSQLRGTTLAKSEWETLAASDDRVHLLNISPAAARNLSAALRDYIKHGEEQEYHRGYKCSIRDPWYMVPSVWTPDAFMFRQIYNFPRIVMNDCGATSTDTIHRFKAKAGDPEHIIANTYTWMTAASAEIEGRSYGGGVLELEPTEAERLLVPATLNGALPVAECDRLIRADRLDDVLDENARTVLRGHMGLSASDCNALKNIWTKMRDRRMARRKTAPSTKA